MIVKRASEIILRGLHFGPTRARLHASRLVAMFPLAHRSNVYVSIPSRHCRHDHPYRVNLSYRTPCCCLSCSSCRCTSVFLFFPFLVSPVHHRPHVFSPIAPCRLSVSCSPLISNMYHSCSKTPVLSVAPGWLPPAAPHPVP